MYGSVIDVDNPTEKDKGQSILIKLKSKKYQKDLEDWENCISFNFPDDDDCYGDLEVNIINKAQTNRKKETESKNKPYL